MMLFKTSPRAGEVTESLLSLLFFNISFFLKKLAKTSVTAENVPLIRHLEFAERERDLLIAYFSSFFPHKTGELFNTQTLANSS